MIKMFSFLLLFPNVVKVYLSKWGRDERYTEDLDNEILSQIRINFIKKYVLKKLLDNNISEIDKLQLIEKELPLFDRSIVINDFIYTPNLLSGDLYKDYNFTIY